jgi:ATP-dependent Clp protease ATP-binding subunit ClpA
MMITVPAYVEGKKPGGGPTVYEARPLFFNGPSARGDRLDRLLSHLTRELVKHLTDLAKEPRHDHLAASTFNPRLHSQRLELTLILRRRTAQCRFLFVSFSHLGRRIAFTPSIPNLWFDLARGEKIADRANEVLTRHFRAQEQENERLSLDKVGITGTAFVTALDMDVPVRVEPPKTDESKFLMLGGGGSMDGAAELHRVGRCLDWLYPDDLDRVELRTAELTELKRQMEQPDRRPVLIVGPRQVGKSALVQEHVYRTVQERGERRRNRGNYWLLSPARLISGMSYVGQWENRLLAILKHARKRNHVLYFDDLIGLFHAGRTCNSTLSVAHVLKPYLERRSIRVLGEITPEGLRVLREQDRGFADLFHLLPVRPPNDEETLQILIGVQRRLEGLHRCRFALDVVPLVLDLQRRYGGDAAFPGKAAALLTQLAVKYRRADIDRYAVLREFQARSGLTFGFLDQQVRLHRDEIVEQVSARVIGQDGAVQAAADVIAIAKARLNDPDRPLASFLFLGPTGVGKTECAKAVAAYLFGSSERLLRFDLNEYATPDSATRLVGTFGQPEGLLTSAIRRQPFAVILFDEVEKAHPEVFDLLLQVLGEGRLSDALGRTADFTNALLVLTSNLGVREAESLLGFRSDEEERGRQFVNAAERFFRPEFFNRLDRIIPFQRLRREHVRRIAGILMEDILRREGLVQRQCFLAVEEPALEQIVDLGFDPVLGARALKRSIERQLTQPIAAQLAGIAPAGFVIVHVYPGRPELTVRVEKLDQVQGMGQPPLAFDAPERLLEQTKSAVERIEGECASLRPEGPITLGQVRTDDYRYFSLRERVRQVRRHIGRIEDRMEVAKRARRHHPLHGRADAPRVHSYKVWRDYSPKLVLEREISAARNINEYLRELVKDAQDACSDPNALELWDLVRQVNLLQAMAEAVRHPGKERVVLWPRGFTAGHDREAAALLSLYQAALPSLDLDVSELKEDGAVLVQGPHAWPILEREVGVHLLCRRDSPIEPLQVIALPVEADEDPLSVIQACRQGRALWLQELAKGAAAAVHDPMNPGRLVRVYDNNEHVVDLRTGLVTAGMNLLPCLLATLPHAAEFAGS